MQRPNPAFLDDLASDFEQPSILHAGRAGGFTGATGEAPIEVSPGLSCRPTLDHLLDQVDPAAWSVAARRRGDDRSGRPPEQKPQCTQLRMSSRASLPRAELAYSPWTSVYIAVVRRPSEHGVHPSGVEYAGWVEGLLERAVQGEQGGWQRCKDLFPADRSAE